MTLSNAGEGIQIIEEHPNILSEIKNRSLKDFGSGEHFNGSSSLEFGGDPECWKF